MLWMLDEFETIHGGKHPGFITGKPVGSGGSLGRTEATGYGVIYTLREALIAHNVDITKTTASVQGFGNVAQYAIRKYSELGGKVVACSSWDQEDQTSYTFKKESGVDADELMSVTDKFGGINKTKAKELGYEVLPGGDWIKQNVDILIPAALENQVNADTIKFIGDKVKFVVEGANGPTTPDADKLFMEKGIFVIPDFLANAGGVTCSYFEQVQGNMNFFWTKEDVLTKLDEKMTSAFYAVLELSRKKKLYMRDAAYVIAISRVVQASKERGWV
jgi:glutamate dehydrogenase (NAD(P)+)